MRKGFTLAEVLITLGIIGVVASLTMPALIANYRKKEVAVKLEKFYVNINKAIKFSEVENGPASEWTYPTISRNYVQMQTFYDTYLAQYLLTTKVEPCISVPTEEPRVCTYFPDGTMAMMDAPDGIDINFYIKKRGNGCNFPRCIFTFNLNKPSSFYTSAGARYLVEPYTDRWNGTPEGLKTGDYACTKAGLKYFCTKLIQLNNWQIPDDYPW
ncbi:MAG: prepilin-type N-terminal cleavage/methylation domain-containing protein [Heliobacteriaceae bacterium]|jgi:prepilin-type N-terminal cleavage/methylation domain-containing protein|nr:prepilin-type N-terminal cleavage/methylation domain-containing protein [Heliobacteriaceae bacterium]